MLLLTLRGTPTLYYGDEIGIRQVPIPPGRMRDPAALHVVIQDQAGFHLPAHDPRVPQNLRLLPLPPYSPELNPVEKLGDLVKDRVCNRIYPNLRRLEDHILAALRPWRTDQTRVAALIGDGWLLDGLNAGAPT